MFILPFATGCRGLRLLARRLLLLRAQQKLHADIRDPARLAILPCHCLQPSPAHQQQAEVAAVIQRLSSTHIGSKLPLFGRTVNSVGILQVVDLTVELSAVIEFMSGNQAASPDVIVCVTSVRA